MFYTGGERVDGCPLKERVCRPYGDSIDRYSIPENHIDKSLNPVWIKGDYFFPVIFAGSMFWDTDFAMLFFGQQGIVMLYLRRRLLNIICDTSHAVRERSRWRWPCFFVHSVFSEKYLYGYLLLAAVGK